MHLASAFGCFLLYPMLARAAAPEAQHARAPADASLADVRLRVRVFEVSLTKMNGMKLQGLNSLAKDSVKLEKQLALLLKARAARLRSDDIISIADGSEARFHPFSNVAQARPQARPVTHPRSPEIKISLAPRLKKDDPVRVSIACNERRSTSGSNTKPQAQVNGSTTTADLADGAAIVLEGATKQRVASQIRGILPIAALSRETQTLSQTQTVVIVTREPSPKR